MSFFSLKRKHTKGICIIRKGTGIYLLLDQEQIVVVWNTLASWCIKFRWNGLLYMPDYQKKLCEQYCIMHVMCAPWMTIMACSPMRPIIDCRLQFIRSPVSITVFSLGKQPHMQTVPHEKKNTGTPYIYHTS
jgi:hypothetical protein